MKASMAACSASWLNIAVAAAEAGIEVDAGWEPTMIETSDDAIEAGTPPDVNAADTEDVSSGGLRKLDVGEVVVVELAAVTEVNGYVGASSEVELEKP